jgi:hypothetical protein
VSLINNSANSTILGKKDNIEQQEISMAFKCQTFCLKVRQHKDIPWAQVGK